VEAAVVTAVKRVKVLKEQAAPSARVPVLRRAIQMIEGLSVAATQDMGKEELIKRFVHCNILYFCARH
jgi:hypothetical protein